MKVLTQIVAVCLISLFSSAYALVQDVDFQAKILNFDTSSQSGNVRLVAIGEVASIENLSGSDVVTVSVKIAGVQGTVYDAATVYSLVDGKVTNGSLASGRVAFTYSEDDQSIKAKFAMNLPKNGFSCRIPAAKYRVEIGFSLADGQYVGSEAEVGSVITQPVNCSVI